MNKGGDRDEEGKRKIMMEEKRMQEDNDEDATGRMSKKEAREDNVSDCMRTLRSIEMEKRKMLEEERMKKV